MTADQYRQHRSAPLRRAFFRGEQAAEAGRRLADNPYREVRVTKKARRGSWSEAFSRAWAVGWASTTYRLRQATGPAAAGAELGGGS